MNIYRLFFYIFVAFAFTSCENCNLAGPETPPGVINFASSSECWTLGIMNQFNPAGKDYPEPYDQPVPLLEIEFSTFLGERDGNAVNLDPNPFSSKYVDSYSGQSVELMVPEEGLYALRIRIEQKECNPCCMSCNIPEDQLDNYSYLCETDEFLEKPKAGVPVVEFSYILNGASGNRSICDDNNEITIESLQGGDFTRMPCRRCDSCPNSPETCNF